MIITIIMMLLLLIIIIMMMMIIILRNRRRTALALDALAVHVALILIYSNAYMYEYY